MITDQSSLVAYKVMIKIQTINKNVKTKNARTQHAPKETTPTSTHKFGPNIGSAKTEPTTHTRPTHDAKYVTIPPYIRQ